MFYGGPGFLAVALFGSSPTSSRLFRIKLLCLPVHRVNLTDGKGDGAKSYCTTARKHGPL